MQLRTAPWDAADQLLRFKLDMKFYAMCITWVVSVHSERKLSRKWVPIIENGLESWKLRPVSCLVPLITRPLVFIEDVRQGLCNTSQVAVAVDHHWLAYLLASTALTCSYLVMLPEYCYLCWSSFIICQVLLYHFYKPSIAKFKPLETMALALDQQAVNEIVVTTVLFTLATVIIALRFIVRRILRNSLDVSDWLTAISWSILLALFVQIVLWAAIGGDGEEMKDVSPPTMTRFFKVISSIGLSAGQAAHLTQIFYANMITYFVLAPCIKLSLVFFFRSLFPIRNFRIATNIVASLISTWGVAIILVGIFQCTPIDTFWHPSNGGVCIDLMAFLYGVQYPNIIFDFTLLFMPVPVIWNIQRPTREKVALTGIFTLGGIGCVSGIVRVIVLGYLESSNLTCPSNTKPRPKRPSLIVSQIRPIRVRYGLW